MKPVPVISMFAGKGGVGKTSCAAATALHHVARGKKTLAISTDAAPSLSHIFELTGGAAALPESLSIRELGEPEIKEMWDGKFGREVYEVFSSFVSVRYEDFVEFMTSLLPGLGEEFMVDYIRELSRKGAYESIIWDTAPLGQTLALLRTPAMLARHLKLAPRIYSRLKVGRQSREPVLDILRRWEALSEEDMAFLRSRVEFNLVSIPEALSVEQLDGVFRELDQCGFRVKRLIVNNVISEPDSPFLAMRARQQRPYLDAMRLKYAALEIVELPMFPWELKGLERLREAEKILFGGDGKPAPV
ncbi:MAG: ArsA family ATPase [Chloroflexi bacterium]|nr:ArsA family ATPase [Chloroflexota bacterium]